MADNELATNRGGRVKVCWAALLAFCAFIPYCVSWFSFGGMFPILISCSHWLLPPAVAALSASAVASRTADFWRISRAGGARATVGAYVLASSLAAVALGASGLWCCMVLGSLAYGG